LVWRAFVEAVATAFVSRSVKRGRYDVDGVEAVPERLFSKRFAGIMSPLRAAYAVR